MVFMKGKIKTSVAISRSWEGDTVASDIISKIKRDAPKPKFILLFLTIHYENEMKRIITLTIIKLGQVLTIKH